MKSSARTDLLREILHTHFPAVFAGKDEPKQPLAIGIGREVTAQMPEINATHLATALADYTRGPTYLKACVEGAKRIGIDGKPHGVVTANEAAYAAERLRGMAHFAMISARQQEAAGESGEIVGGPSHG